MEKINNSLKNFDNEKQVECFICGVTTHWISIIASQSKLDKKKFYYFDSHNFKTIEFDRQQNSQHFNNLKEQGFPIISLFPDNKIHERGKGFHLIKNSLEKNITIEQTILEGNVKQFLKRFNSTIESHDIYYWIENFFPIPILERYFLKDMKLFKESFTFKETDCFDKLLKWHEFVLQKIGNNEKEFKEKKIDFSRFKTFLNNLYLLLKN